MTVSSTALNQPFRRPRLLAHKELVFAIAGGLFFLAGLAAGPVELAVFFYILSYGVGGYFKAREGLTDLIHDRSLNVEILMILAALGAASIGYWSEGAILIFIFAMSGALETYTLQKSEKDLSELVKLAPEQAVLVTNGKTVTVPVDSLRRGDVVLVRNGERIPADGIVRRGASAVDESAITGEPVPVEKLDGSDVFNGTMNGSGTLEVEVTRENKDSLFQKMIALVDEAKTSRPPAQRFIERIEGPYVITVLIATALLIALPPLLWQAPFEATFYRAMVMLVVASPCAVVASIMPALLSAISTGARFGLLTKGGIPLEQLVKTNVIAVDKTGTLTKGSPRVTNVYALNGSEEQALAAVAGTEAESSHPLARAVTSYASRKGIQLRSPLTTTSHTGKGIEAAFEDGIWQIGNETWARADSWPEEARRQHRAWTSTGHTVIFALQDNTPRLMIALKDEVRPEAAAFVKEMTKYGIETVMITGDNEETAKAIASETGIRSWVSRCMPEQKVTEIERLRREKGAVVMIGDGVNDAPAMAKADIGIAMGSGTDVAVDTADMVLMKSDLSKIMLAVRLSSRLRRIVIQNLVFSSAVILFLLTANFAQSLTLPLGVIGHEGSTILVILNGLRLLRA
ncbi:heavy metal translocating P-type ATPase [Alkalicoccus luteus]|uniref:Heavy metal translocating P-type ATPase n=1 Tax=Alkalicoccus luteus TaxID=1237094 RepID=A0A969PQW2_9BACI|nr:heavy metal translocating P-type ATPase [Alkalicoccus luteus]NJP37349.1 heavy metal translocating P-type ATPase [Alkalicoccus luteus]